MFEREIISSVRRQELIMRETVKYFKNTCFSHVRKTHGNLLVGWRNVLQLSLEEISALTLRLDEEYIGH